MTIRLKMVWTMSIWLIFILLCLNLGIYYLFIHMATANEREMLQSKVDNITENVDASILIQKNQGKALLGFLSDNSMLMVLDRQSNIVNQISNDQIATSVHHKFSKQPVNTITTVKNNKVLVIEAPIDNTKGTIVGSIVMAETLVSLEGNIKVLIYLLLFSSIGAVILCIIGVWILSGAVLNPITKMINTMQEVDRSLVFKKIPLTSKSKDELYVMAATFNRMIERIEQSFIKQGQFVSDASHELKTPLTIIESYVNLLRRWGKQDKAVQEEAILAIHEESIRMKELIQQLLDLATMESGQELKIERVNLGLLVRDVVKLCETMNDRPINVTTQSEPLTVCADRNKLKQVLFILLDNAMKYSEDSIEIYIGEMEKNISMTIKDYGTGIPKEELELIFERFYRVDKARQRKTGGTGLGLSIAKTIISQHGGVVNVISEEGQGTEIKVNLPRSEDC